MKGLLVALEGIDGAGKTTLARQLMALLAGKGAPGVTVTSEPTQSIYRARVMNGCVTASTADRALHAAQVINPALERGEIVITDRYYGSCAAYGGVGDRAVLDILHEQAKVFAVPGVWIHVSPRKSICRARVESRGELWDCERMDDVNYAFIDLIYDIGTEGAGLVLWHGGGDEVQRLRDSTTEECAAAILAQWRALNA